MSETSLNLIAITIFTLVMSALLGPLVHLSPVVPAIAVAGVMGLATLDTLSWQGQGSTILVDWVAGFSPEHRARVVRHEAGHFLVAHRLSIPVIGYTLTAWEAFRQGQPGVGGVSFDTTELDANLAQGKISAQQVDRYCTVWMAGIAAELLAYGNSEGGNDDRQKIAVLCDSLKRPDRTAEQTAKWAQLQAKTLLETNQATYDALVAAMERRASLEECLQILSTQTNS